MESGKTPGRAILLPFRAQYRRVLRSRTDALRDEQMDQRTRTEKIFEKVQAARLVKLSELSSEFGVSMPTIRKDIDELQKQGRVERVHGNVRLVTSEAGPRHHFVDRA